MAHLFLLFAELAYVAYLTLYHVGLQLVHDMIEPLPVQRAAFIVEDMFLFPRHIFENRNYMSVETSNILLT